jgi:quinol monooxygenase YgiN
VTLNCRIKPERYEALVPFLAENLPNVRSFPGCQRVSVYFDRDDREMLLDEDWLSVEAHQSYIDFITDNGILGSLAAFLEGPPDIRYFTQAAL